MRNARRGTTQEVVVVTADWALRELLRLLLEDRSYTVRETAGESDAMELIEAAHNPLIVMLDISATDTTGFDVLRAVAHDPVPCFNHAYIVLTPPRQGLPCDVWPLVEALSIPVLCKPLDLDELIETVELLSYCLRSSLEGADPLSL